jgi:hypothetical protein
VPIIRLLMSKRNEPGAVNSGLRVALALIPALVAFSLHDCDTPETQATGAFGRLGAPRDGAADGFRGDESRPVHITNWSKARGAVCDSRVLARFAIRYVPDSRSRPQDARRLPELIQDGMEGLQTEGTR